MVPQRSNQALVVGLVFALCFGATAWAQTLQYGDGTANGKRSFGGGGHLIMFNAPKDRMWLNRIEVFGSRYGMPQPPDEDFKVYVVNGERQILWEVSLPYLLWQRGAEYWRTLPSPPVQVPQQFGIGLTFNAAQTKGVYVGTGAATEVHSYSWLLGEQGKLMEGVDWLVRATVADSPEGDPKATDLVIQPDGNGFFDKFLGAAGDPLTISLAGHGAIPKAQVSTVRMRAAGAPAVGEAAVYLVNGTKLVGKITGLDDKVVRIRVGDADREIARPDVVRIDFQ